MPGRVELRSGEAGGKGKCGTAERKTKPSASRRKVNVCRRHDEGSGMQDARLIGQGDRALRHPAALEEDCRVADIVIARFQRRQRVQHGASGGSPARASGGSMRSTSRGVDKERKRRRDSRAKALGALSGKIARPAPPAGQAHAKDQGAADDNDADDRRFDGNPNE